MIYEAKRTPHFFFTHGRSLRIIYVRLETAYIWLRKTVLRFLSAIYGRFQTTSYGCVQTPSVDSFKPQCLQPLNTCI